MESKKKSIVPVLFDQGKLAGTAFLFKQDRKFCYWMTCHHVISYLNQIRILECFHSDNKEVEAEYLEDLSSPEKDIAILKSKNDYFSEYSVVHLGDSGLKTGDPTCKNHTNGYIYGFSSNSFNERKTNRPRINTSFGIGSKREIQVYKESDIEYINKLSSPWNISISCTEMTFFEIFEAREKIVEGFSGCPLFNNFNVCIGMITQSTEKGAGTKTLEAIAIPYAEIQQALGADIPFYYYSDCVIVVLAGKRKEIENRLKENPKLDYIDSKYYDNSNREQWIPFDRGKDIRSLINNAVNIKETFYQMSTLYIDQHSDELIQYIERGHSGLLFIIDVCSLGLYELEKIVRLANLDFKRASYFFIETNSIFKSGAYPTLDKLLKKHLPAVIDSKDVEHRHDNCNTGLYFKKRIQERINVATAYGLNMSQLDSKNINSKLNVYDVPSSPFNSLPRP